MNNIVDATLQEVQQVKKENHFWRPKYMKCEKLLNKRSNIRIHKMGHWQRMLSTKPGDQSLIPGTHMLEEGNWLLSKLPSHFSKCSLTYVPQDVQRSNFDQKGSRICIIGTF